MKRYIALFMTFVALMGALAVPASAAEIDNDCYTNLLDFSTIKDEGSAFWTLQPNEAPIWLSLPYFSAPKRVEFTFRCSGGFTGSVGVAIGSANDPTSFTNLTVQKIDTNLYRAYGDISGSGYRVYIKFNVTSTAWLQLFNFNLMFTENNVFNITGQMTIRTGSGYLDVINFNVADTINYREWNVDGTVTANDVQFIATSDQWKKYDFLDFQFLYYVDSINTVSAMLGNTNLSCTYNIVENSSGDSEKFYYVTCRVDLRGVDRTTSSQPMVRIEGSEPSYSGARGYAGVVYMAGIVEEAEVSFLTFWFNKITKGIDNIVNALSDQSGSDDLQSSVDQAGSGLDDLGASLDSVTRPAVDGINTDLSGIVSQVDINTSTSLLTNVMSNNYIGQIISMVAVLATAGYVLYGKR